MLANVFKARNLNVLSVLVLAATLRLITANSELWLDEVWCLNYLKTLNSPLEIYFSDKTNDGHSSLETVLLYLLPRDLPDFFYRIPSLIFSLASLPLILILGPTCSKERTLLFTGYSFSFAVILYGNEARGYSGLIFFTTLSMLCHLRILEGRSKWFDPLIFFCSSVLAFLFHYSYLIWLLAAIGSAFTNLLFKAKKNQSQNYIFWGHILAFWIIVFIYLTVVRKIGEGNGPKSGWLDPFISMLSLTLGGLTVSPSSPNLLLLILAVAGLLLFVSFKEFDYQIKNNPSKAIFFLLATLIIPITVIIIKNSQVVFLRYFLTSLLTFLFILASFTARSISAAKMTKNKLLAYCCIITFVIGNSYNLSNLVRWRYGNYSTVIKKSIQLAPSDSKTIDLLVDQPFRHKTLLDYYSKEYKFNLIDSYNTKLEKEDLPSLLLYHTQDWNEKTKNQIKFRDSVCYKLITETDFNHLSGWRNFLYNKTTNNDC